jgi:hypothetical protein
MKSNEAFSRQLSAISSGSRITLKTEIFAGHVVVKLTADNCGRLASSPGLFYHFQFKKATKFGPDQAK